MTKEKELNINELPFQIIKQSFTLFNQTYSLFKIQHRRSI
jgi:hypothetical protein